MERAIAASLEGGAAAGRSRGSSSSSAAVPPPPSKPQPPHATAAPPVPQPRAPAQTFVSLVDDDDDDGEDYRGLIDNGAASDDDAEAPAAAAAAPAPAPAVTPATAAAGMKRRRSDDGDAGGVCAAGNAAASAPVATPVAGAASSAAAPTSLSSSTAFSPLPAPAPLDIPPEPPAGAAGCTRVQIRLPDGARLVRRFAAGETVACLYAVVAATLRRPHTLAGLYVRARAAAASAAAPASSSHGAGVGTTAAVAPDDLVAVVCSLALASPRLQRGAASGAASVAARAGRAEPLDSASLDALRLRLPENVSVAPLPPPPLQGGAVAPASPSSASEGDLPLRPLRLGLRVSATGVAAAAVTSPDGRSEWEGAAPHAAAATTGPLPCFDHWDLGLPAPWVSLGAWAGATLAEAGLGAASAVVVRLLV